ncbi:MAG: hypothetical protein Q4A29_09225, partial [Eubacteriales bacterium]|nr:hypothetical protein [Eubacteriales bacterium]
AVTHSKVVTKDKTVSNNKVAVILKADNHNMVDNHNRAIRDKVWLRNQIRNKQHGIVQIVTQPMQEDSVWNVAVQDHKL